MTTTCLQCKHPFEPAKGTDHVLCGTCLRKNEPALQKPLPDELVRRINVALLLGVNVATIADFVERKIQRATHDRLRQAVQRGAITAARVESGPPRGQEAQRLRRKGVHRYAELRDKGVSSRKAAGTVFDEVFPVFKSPGAVVKAVYRSRFSGWAIVPHNWSCVNVAK